MVSKVTHWLASPVFLDEEKTRIARLLNYTLLGLSGISVADAALLLVFAPETLSTFWINGVAVLFCLMLMLLMRWGRVRLAALLFCLVMWLLLVYYIAISGGLHSPAFGFLTLLSFVAAVLLDIPGAIGMGGLCLITTIWLYTAGSSGALVSEEGLPTLSRLFASNTAIIVSVTIFMMITT